MVTLLELAGFIALVVAGALVDPAFAWAIAGVGLVGKAFELESRKRPEDQP